MDWVEIVGFAGTALTFAAWGMKGAVALRAFGIASSVAFLSFGLLSETWPVVATELALLPLNAFRLWQLLRDRTAASDFRRRPRGQGRAIRSGEDVLVDPAALEARSVRGPGTAASVPA